MARPRPLPSQEYLHSLFDYDPETGEVIWKSDGRIAFTRLNPDGYAWDNIDYASYLAHRVVYKWMTGEDPELVDHNNGVRDDNRWSNIQSVTPVGNCRNRALRADNTSGVVGVSFDKRRQKWWAGIHVQGRTRNLGTFTSFDDAIAARKAAEREHGFHPNHGRAPVRQAKLIQTLYGIPLEELV